MSDRNEREGERERETQRYCYTKNNHGISDLMHIFSARTKFSSEFNGVKSLR